MNIQSTKVTSTTKKKPPHNKLLNILKVIPNKKESDKHLTVMTEAGSNNLNTLGVSGNSPSNFGKEGESVRTYCFSTTVTFTSGGA